jgi:hypothetical protein
MARQSFLKHDKNSLLPSSSPIHALRARLARCYARVTPSLLAASLKKTNAAQALITPREKQERRRQHRFTIQLYSTIFLEKGCWKMVASRGEENTRLLDGDDARKKAVRFGVPVRVRQQPQRRPHLSLAATWPRESNSTLHFPPFF